MEDKELLVNENQKKKSRKGLIIFIILLILIILGLVGYICYDKFFTKELEVKEEKEKKTSNELSSSEIDEINEMVQELSNSFAKYYPIKKMDEINNQDLLLFALQKIGFVEEIKKSEIEEVIKKYFGDVKIKHEDIDCPTEHDEKLYLYEDGKYIPNPEHGGHGGGGNAYAAPFYVSSAKEGDVVNVNYKILYSNMCGDTCILNAYYRTYEDSKNSENPVLEGDDSSDDPGVNLTEKLYKSVEVKIPVTTFTFEKTDDGYTLKSVKIHE